MVPQLVPTAETAMAFTIKKKMLTPCTGYSKATSGWLVGKGCTGRGAMALMKRVLQGGHAATQPLELMKRVLQGGHAATQPLEKRDCSRMQWR
jgi:hypothetical protein